MKIGLCFYCKHLHQTTTPGKALTCEAFPTGVPEEIAFGDVVHDKPYPGDNGIQYEPISVSTPHTAPSLP